MNFKPREAFSAIIFKSRVTVEWQYIPNFISHCFHVLLIKVVNNAIIIIYLLN